MLPAQQPQRSGEALLAMRNAGITAAIAGPLALLVARDVRSERAVRQAPPNDTDQYLESEMNLAAF